MRGIYFPGGRQAVLEESPDPEDVPAGWAAVAVRGSGICGTDLHRYRLDQAERSAARGWRTGHEAVGYRVGGDLVPTDERVVVYHAWGCMLPDGPCPESRHPGSKRCPHTAVMGLDAHGANGTYQVVPSDRLLPLPPGVGWEDGVVLACNYPTAWTACRRARVDVGDRVLVTGLGPVGLLAALIAAHRGAQVLGLDRSAQRVHWAREQGVRATGNPAVLTGAEAGYDCIIETTGAPAIGGELISALAPQGTSCLVGLGGTTTFGAARELILKEVNLVGSLIFTMEDWPAIVADYQAMPVRPAHAVISLRAVPADAPEAFKKADAAEVSKVFFDWTA